MKYEMALRSFAGGCSSSVGFLTSGCKEGSVKISQGRRAEFALSHEAERKVNHVKIIPSL